ncbi:MAG: hypothetical protein ABIQ88_09335 [Chitinophagaceae bacterium]
MSGTIILNPSASQTALADAISQACTGDKSLQLAAGIHLTKPGYRNKIKVPAEGITIKGDGNKELVFIKRPDGAIGSVVEGRPDDNYGLFFIPADPTAGELIIINNPANNRWKKYEGDCNQIYWYATMLRGKIDISNVTLDCNMQQQGLAAIYSAGGNAEHSCMIGFSGTYYNIPPGIDGIEKRIYIGFEAVSITNIHSRNGGYADDIWCARGYFYPNISTVSIDNIKAFNRVHPKRATISFSGLAKDINISNADIYRLECEETSADVRQQPAHESFAGSKWIINNVKTDYIDIAAKGHVLYIQGDQLETKKGFNLYQATGFIKRSIFRREGQDPRLFRLNHFLFEKVKWIFTAVEEGPNKEMIMGIRPVTQYGEPFSATFLKNEFLVDGPFTGGQLISSEFTRLEPGNILDVIFKNCKYDNRFGTGEFPIAIVREKGTCTFKKTDFGTRDRTVAVVAGDPEFVKLVWI